MSAISTQVDGDHYRKLKIQPVQYIHANKIPFIEGCIIKYATRWRDKGGIKDLNKIRHFVDLLIELEASPGDGALEYPNAIDDESPRMQAIGQNGPSGEHYDELLELAEVAILNGGAPLKEPHQPRHRCLACAGGHPTHEHPA